MVNEHVILDCVRDVPMETPHGRFLSAAIRLRDVAGRESEHLCLYRGVGPGSICLLRLNSACLTSELFGCQRCDCIWQLAEALRMFEAEESCALVYTPTDEGRGHGLVSKLRAYLGSDGTASSGLEGRYLATRDLRQFRSQAFAARWLGVRRARLLSDNDAKRGALVEEGIEAVEVVGLRSPEPRLADFYRFRDRFLSGDAGP
ncbi:hypothetical protein WMF11_05555 [Sorangium sp. So ce295]|jgi:GTP cyclohydrolase II|uniref:GTP cyclohydrolase II n=1 Tax=Sorangium sp. So ce295 TaxID=3133295 RepID=UPI003F62DC3E